jgi:hypothetical protein
MIIVSSGTGTVTNINTALPLSGGPITTSGTITTAITTNKLIGRSTAGTGVMEEITVGTGLSLTGGTLSSTGGTPAGNSTEIQYNNAGAFGANSNLKWDITNNRAIIGTEAVADTNSRLVVIGKGQSTNTTFAVHNQLGNNNALIVRDDSRVGIGTASPTNRLSVNGSANIQQLTISTDTSTGSGGFNRGTSFVNSDISRIFFFGLNTNAFYIEPTLLRFSATVAGGTINYTTSQFGGTFQITTSSSFYGDRTMMFFSQNQNIGYVNPIQSFGVCTTTPNATAALDVSSTERGFLPPRMTTAQRNLIATPATGLTIFNTDNNTINQRTSSAWVDLVSSNNYDGLNVAFGTTNGTKIGTATTQKIGFWNATPIVQPTTAVTAATLVSGGGTNIKEDCTFDGYTIGQVVKALRNAGLLT